MTAPQQPTADQYYAAQMEQLRLQLAAIVGTLWAVSTVGGVFSTLAAAEFVRRLVPVQQGAQQVMSSLTTARFNSLAQAPEPVIVSPTTVTGSALRGVEPAVVYERPFNEVRWRLSTGMPEPQAAAAGLRRAKSLSATDLQLAHTRTAQSYIEGAEQRIAASRERGLRAWEERRARQAQEPAPRRTEPTLGPRGNIVGYRRVLSSRPNHCALCVLASTQRYHRADLMPIHPGCGCHVEPVFTLDGRSPQVLDPGLAQEIHNIIRRDLGDAYVDAGGRKGPAQYRDVIVTTNEHGELGPLLGVRGQHFEADPAKPSHLGHIRVNPVEPPPDEINLDEIA